MEIQEQILWILKHIRSALTYQYLMGKYTQFHYIELHCHYLRITQIHIIDRNNAQLNIDVRDMNLGIFNVIRRLL
jgi:hypothetical protein